jgi:TRAP-type C4-dicarboxylate transport system permease small subunit
MMLSICGSIIFRRTSLNFGWALEVSEYILIVITLFGAGWLLRTAGHVRVDIVATHIHGKRKALYDAIIFSAVAVICLAFTLIGINAVGEAYSTGTTEIKVYFEFKKWILHSLFPVAGFVLCVESTKLVVKNLKNYFSIGSNSEE